MLTDFVAIFTSEMCPKDTKLSLNQEELVLVNNKSLIDSKRKVLSHIVELLVDAENSVHQLVADYRHLLPDEMISKRGKISKGENYKGYPWVVLDHPALFGKVDFMAFRTLFWWGDSFSLIFQAGGKYLSGFGTEKFIASLSQQFPELLVCIGESPWEHHYERDNYTMLSDDFNVASFHSHCNGKNFLKIAFRFPLERINEMNFLLTERMTAMLELWQSGANNLS